MSGTKRITKEFADLSTSPPPSTTIALGPTSDIHIWHITLAGPPSTPFASGTFRLTLTLPPDYPFKPPTLNFTTKIYHPNVTNDDKGSMCLGLLRPDEWKPSSRIRDVLVFARGLLLEPVPEDAVEQGIAAEYRAERAAWEKKAREWTARYAK
ncbi:hypothetical protein MMC11_000054 [Xylographa trunciseda]|nr:hypothetical protein [Xylographa trunciseda]